VTVGSSRNENPKVRKALTVATQLGHTGHAGAALTGLVAADADVIVFMKPSTFIPGIAWLLLASGPPKPQLNPA
jgi:hypothetical protein